MAIVTFVRRGGSPLPLAVSLSKKLSERLLIFELDEFADSETRLSFGQKDEVVGENITLVWQFCSGNINAQLFELLLIIGTLRRIGASSIKLVLPYLPYSRQDISLSGLDTGPITTLSDMFLEFGIDELVCLELHSLDIVRFSRVIIKEIECSKFWVNHIRSLYDTKNLVIVSPDKGGYRRAKSVADCLRVEIAYVSKERFGVDMTRALALHGDVNGKSVILIDDIVDTAGTAINACDMLLNNGANSVTGCFVHGVLSSGAIEKLEDSGFDKIFVTDSITSCVSMSKIMVLSMVEFFGENL